MDHLLTRLFGWPAPKRVKPFQGFATKQNEVHVWENGLSLPPDTDLWVGSIMSLPDQGITRRKPWDSGN